MNKIVLKGNPPVTVGLRISTRARQIALRICGQDGRVTLTVPANQPLDQALDFVHEKSDWIRHKLSKLTPPELPAFGNQIMFEGRLHDVLPGPGRKVVQRDVALLVPGAPEQVPTRLRIFLAYAARDRLVEAADRHSRALGRNYRKIALRDTRSRWGSCSSAGRLMFSWRLVMAPPEVLDYVAAHEVAHLEEMNHSPAYWKVVSRLLPGYEAPRRWLKRNGQDLHRYRFD